jgi:hypothetical protein
MRRRVAILFALVACFAGTFAATAQADEIIEFMSHTFLAGGGNDFGPHFNNLSWVWGHSSGHAASCVGVSGHPEYQICRGENEGAKTEYIGFAGTSYLHNHSTYESYFYAWAQGYN